jgi:hypothetical protein
MKMTGYGATDGNGDLIRVHIIMMKGSSSMALGCHGS